MLDLLGLRGNEFAEGIFSRCGVERRHLELNPKKLGESLQARTPETELQLLDLAVCAVDQLDFDPGRISTVISSNYYSLGGPTLAHRLVEHYELDPATDKYHVLGIGCASAVPLFKMARQALNEAPDSAVLVVAAESVSGFLTGVEPDDERTKIVGNALFGDGCAAALLTAQGANGGRGALVRDPVVHQVAGTLGSVNFKLVDEDSYMHIGRELPQIAANDLRPLVERYLAANGTSLEGINHFVVHPGGRGIIDGVQQGLSLSDEAVAVSREVLAAHGNMGTPSSFYVLDLTEQRRRPAPGETGLMITIGPGVTIGLMLLDW